MTVSLSEYLRSVFAAPPLRPPGARTEREFAALCIRCGRCAEICPYRAVRAAGWMYGPEAATPLIEPRRQPCWLCMLCPPVCPTGALVPIREPRRVRMGGARVAEDRCFAFQGILCRTCVDACPFPGEAIRQDAELHPVVTDACVGCGICEHRCPVDEPAITIEPRKA